MHPPYFPFLFGYKKEAQAWDEIPDPWVKVNI